MFSEIIHAGVSKRQEKLECPLKAFKRLARRVDVASIAGLRGRPPNVRLAAIAYHTSKGAVVNFTCALAGEWGPHGITVDALAPGFFPSKMSQPMIEHFAVEQMISNVPFGRLGDDEDLKCAALLFPSDAGKHITGQILAIDGGQSAV